MFRVAVISFAGRASDTTEITLLTSAYGNDALSLVHAHSLPYFDEGLHATNNWFSRITYDYSLALEYCLRSGNETHALILEDDAPTLSSNLENDLGEIIAVADSRAKGGWGHVKLFDTHAFRNWGKDDVALLSAITIAGGAFGAAVGYSLRIRLPRDWRCMASFCLAMFCAYSSCRWMFIIGKHNSWMAHPSGLWPTNSSNCGTQANMFPREALGAVIEFLREHSGEAPHDFLLQSMSQSHAELALLRQLPPLFYHTGKSSTRDS